MKNSLQILVLLLSTEVIYIPASFVEPSVPVSGESCGCGLRTGPPGKDGRDGKDGLSVQGPPGLPGPAGRDGKDGRDGLVGQTGPKGDEGDVGAPGQAGEPGEPGLPGPKGTCDPSEVNALRATISSLQTKLEVLRVEAENNFTAYGEKLKETEKDCNNKLSSLDSRLTLRMLELLNIIKAVNASRIPGPKGSVGSSGPQGAQGPKGDIGPKGDTGPQGLQGQTGPQGPQGIKGSQGLKGDKGDSGISALANCREMKNETRNDIKPFPTYQLEATAKPTQGYVITGVTCSSSGGTSILSVLNDGSYKCLCSGHTSTSGGRLPPSTLGAQNSRPRPNLPNPWKNLNCALFYWECPVTLSV